MTVIDMSGVTEFDPFISAWMAPAAYVIVAVWGYLARLGPPQRTLHGEWPDGPFDSVRRFFIFMLSATVLAVAMTAVAWLVEFTVWDDTASELAVFRSEVSRLYGISLPVGFELDSENVGVGTDVDGNNVIFRYVDDTATLEFPGEW